MPVGKKSAADYTTHWGDFAPVSSGAIWRIQLCEMRALRAGHRLPTLALPVEESLGGCRSRFFVNGRTSHRPQARELAPSSHLLVRKLAVPPA